MIDLNAQWFVGGLMTAARAGMGVAVWNRRVYLIGGYASDFTTVVSNVESAPIQADGTLGPWRSETPLPSLRAFGMAEVRGDYLYFVGGDLSDGVTATGSLYWTKIGGDGSLGQWKTGPGDPFNTYDDGLNQTVVAGSYLMVIGGNDPNTSVSEFIRLSPDGSPQNWVQHQAPLPVEGLSEALVVHRAGWLYTFGGDDRNADATIAGIYAGRVQPDGQIPQWNSVAALSGGARYQVGGGVLDDTVVVCGGKNVSASSAVTGLTEVYRINDGLVFPGPKIATVMPIPVFYHVTKIVYSAGRRFLMAFGGLDHTGAVRQEVQVLPLD